MINYRPLVQRINRNPVIVLGNQKSGTTAVGAMLAGCMGVTSTLDIPEQIDRPTYVEVYTQGRSFDNVISSAPRAFLRKLIKAPFLTFFYSQLRDVFPRARFVLVLRDPRDNIRSIYDRLRIPGNIAHVSDEQMARIPLPWHYVLDNRWLGIDGCDTIESLAQRWNLVSELARVHRDQMVVVRYEDFMVDKRNALLGVAEHLGVDAPNLSGIDLDRQYQSAGVNRGMPVESFFDEANLERIERICRDDIAYWQYPIKRVDQRASASDASGAAG